MRSVTETEKPVGILSFPDSISYGAVLQMRALYEAVSAMGYRPEIIYYSNSYMRQEKHVGARRRGRKLRKFLRRIGRKLMHRKMFRVFRGFERQIAHYPARVFSESERLKTIAPRYQAIICGSDQVWNPAITGADLSYFLDFCGEKVKRISYAPSFGLDRLPGEFCEQIRAPLLRLDHLSVREREGVELIRRLTGREAELVLDPVFLIPVSRWRELEQPVRTEGPYLLLYLIHNREESFAFAKALAAQRGLRLLILGGNSFSRRRAAAKGLQWLPDLSPENWLYLIRGAACVVTDSFHGLAFSILFRRCFFVSLSSQTNSRLLQLLSATGLTSQIIRPDSSPGEPDYAQAERVLPKLCEDSASFLRHALETEGRDNHIL